MQQENHEPRMAGRHQQGDGGLSQQGRLAVAAGGAAVPMYGRDPLLFISAAVVHIIKKIGAKPR